MNIDNTDDENDGDNDGDYDFDINDDDRYYMFCLNRTLMSE
jgi:hypothetical protein